MTTSLLDSLGQVAGPDLAARAAAQLDEPVQNVSRGMQGAFASILLGLAARSGDPTAMRGALDFVTNPANDGRVLDNPASLINTLGPTTPAASLGSQFQGHVFGNRGNAVRDAIAKSSGLRPNSVASLLSLAAPLVLAVLGKRVRDGGLDVDSFARILASEKPAITRAAPPGVSTALGLEQRTETLTRDYSAPRDERAERAAAYTPVPEKSRNRWVWPVAGLAAAGLLWAMWPRDRAEVRTADTTTTSVYRGGDILPSAPAPMPPIAMPDTTPAPEPKPAAKRSSSSRKPAAQPAKSAPAPIQAPTPMPTPTPEPIRPRQGIDLPNGTSIEAYENGAEVRFVRFLNDPGVVVDESTWVILENVRFANGSATLRPESEAQIANFARILDAYPKATVKVAVAVDSVGDAAANQRLSQARAESVRAGLIRMGVGGRRVLAEGYGSQFPLTDNTTEAGRARNRRVAIRLTDK